MSSWFVIFSEGEGRSQAHVEIKDCLLFLNESREGGSERHALRQPIQRGALFREHEVIIADSFAFLAHQLAATHLHNKSRRSSAGGVFLCGYNVVGRTRGRGAASPSSLNTIKTSATNWECSKHGSTCTVGGIPCGNKYSRALSFDNSVPFSITSTASQIGMAAWVVPALLWWRLCSFTQHRVADLCSVLIQTACCRLCSFSRH